LTKVKRKFICVKPISQKAKELFEYSMLGLQSCELVEQDTNKYLLKPIRFNHNFWIKIKNDPDWEIEK
jgi:hypothetical protein